MTREEAIKELQEDIELYIPLHGTIDDIRDLPDGRLITALEMAIQALSQEPCTVSVSEKEPNEISEEVTLRFFKNSLKVRWHNFVIYNVEWLKKNWQMEMDIVCGVKPCDDAISRDAVIDALSEYVSNEEYEDKSHTFTVKPLIKRIVNLPSVTQKSGKWVEIDDEPHEVWECNHCGFVIDGSGCIEPYEYRDIYKFCPNCGAKMVEPKERSE